jgi:hypothetical protein
MKTQAWGWLAAGVLAAGLNATYHNGGLAWARCIAGNIGHSVCAVMDLATGHADRFMAEAQMLATRDETSSAHLATTLARVPTRIARVQTNFARIETLTAHQEAQVARFESDRARIEAQVGDQIEEKIARARIPASAFNLRMAPMAKLSNCSEMHIDLPRIQSIRVPMAPVVHIDVPGAGPL